VSNLANLGSSTRGRSPQRRVFLTTLIVYVLLFYTTPSESNNPTIQHVHHQSPSTTLFPDVVHVIYIQHGRQRYCATADGECPQRRVSLTSFCLFFGFAIGEYCILVLFYGIVEKSEAQPKRRFSSCYSSSHDSVQFHKFDNAIK